MEVLSSQVDFAVLQNFVTRSFGIRIRYKRIVIFTAN